MSKFIQFKLGTKVSRESYEKNHHFVTLDGVMQAPGGPEEDTSDGFAYGGWSFHHWDEMMGNVMSAFMNIPFELLLGKRTYDIFRRILATHKTRPCCGKAIQ